MSPPPDGVTAQSRWPCGTAIRTYSLYTMNAMRTETFFYSNGLWFNRNSNILVKARCSHIRKIFIKSLHLKHIYAKTFSLILLRTAFTHNTCIKCAIMISGVAVACDHLSVTGGTFLHCLWFFNVLCRYQIIMN